ncbi:MAG: ATP-binding protein [Magnetococcales bacterium]|nr:ATP-binding protein [Magnetococcales bacterium]
MHRALQDKPCPVPVKPQKNPLALRAFPGPRRSAILAGPWREASPIDQFRRQSPATVSGGGWREAFPIDQFRRQSPAVNIPPPISPRRLSRLLDRLEGLLDRWDRGRTPTAELLAGHDVFRWVGAPAGGGRLEPVRCFRPMALGDLLGIDRAREVLERNTRQFAAGQPANDALLWGSRGTGKSSLVKAVAAAHFPRLKLIEVDREELGHLPEILDRLAPHPGRYLLFCDDLSFARHEGSYKPLKALLEGGVTGRPDNVLLYATSNRRHLMPRDAPDAEALHPGEEDEERISLSDRFGLWLGFHPFDQETYLDIVRQRVGLSEITIDPAELERQALDWARLRGGRSGRVAQQFIIDLKGRRFSS